MPSDDQPTQDTVDQTGMLYSVQVPPTAGYLRLGEPDAAPEKALPDPDDPGGAGTGTAFKPGVVVYTTGTYQQIAPTGLDNWHEKITLVGGKGNLSSIDYTATIPTVGTGIKTTVQRLVQTTATAGSVSNYVLGNTLTATVGGNMALGLGARLVANMGTTLNLLDGQIISLNTGVAEVAGWGAYKNTLKHSIEAASQIRFACKPVNGQVTLRAAQIPKRMRYILVGMSALISLTATAIGTGTWTTGAVTENIDILTKAMRASTASFGAATTSIVILQATAIIFAASLKAKAKVDPITGIPFSAISIKPDSIIFKVGQSYISINQFGVRTSSATITNTSPNIAYNPMPLPLPPGGI